MPTLGVEEGEASLESKEDPDFLLRGFLTEVERGGARGGTSPPLPPPTTPPLRDGIDDWDVKLAWPTKGEKWGVSNVQMTPHTTCSGTPHMTCNGTSHM